jgi:nitronate monooxygenase
MADRREFFRRAAAVAASFGLRDVPLSAQPRQAMPTPRASAFIQAFGLKYPICNAGMGTFASSALAIAVSEAGGLGATGTGARFAGGDVAAGNEMMRRVVTQIRAGTKRPFAVNYLLHFDPVSLPVALDAGAPVIQFAWGIPTTDMVRSIRHAGAKMGVQVASGAGARRAIDAGADYLICQGTEAGGHVQASSSLYDALSGVIDEAKSVPVLAAGGIASGAHIRRALLAGASGVLIGTRFIATKEAAVHDEWKSALTRARGADTVLTLCYQDGWPNAPHRVLRNTTFALWEAAGCPPPGKRPGEGDVITTNAVTGTQKKRYSIGGPTPNDRGDIAELPRHAGAGVDAIRDIPPAGELVARLWKECLDAT